MRNRIIAGLVALGTVATAAAVLALAAAAHVAAMSPQMFYHG